jgi:hypothetical protein
VLVALFVDEELATLEADTAQDFHQLLEELGVVDGPGKMEMPKMTRAVVIVLSTGPADLAVFENAHAGIKETVEFAVGRGGARNFAYGSAYNFFWAEHSKLDPYNRLGFGCMG